MPGKKNQRRSTLRDVAEVAGVSTATVSYVMTGRGSVSDKVAKKVLAAARRLDYRPNTAARATRTGKTSSVGLMLPDLTNPFFPALAQAVENTARSRGYAVLLVDAQNDVDAERDGFEHFANHGVDGVIWCPVSGADTLGRSRLSVPVVTIDRPIADYDSVHSKYVEGGQLIADHLLQLGHRKIGIIRGPARIKSARLRYDGVIRGIDGKADIVWESRNPFSLELQDELVDLIEARSATAIVACNDAAAVGVLSEARKRGIDVPRDLSVVGFDDIAWASLVTPPLTTVRQPLEQIGQEALQLLIRRIEDPDLARLTITMDVELVVRGSTAPPPKL